MAEHVFNLHNQPATPISQSSTNKTPKQAGTPPLTCTSLSPPPSTDSSTGYPSPSHPPARYRCLSRGRAASRPTSPCPPACGSSSPIRWAGLGGFLVLSLTLGNFQPVFRFFEAFLEILCVAQPVSFYWYKLLSSPLHLYKKAEGLCEPTNRIPSGSPSSFLFPSRSISTTARRSEVIASDSFFQALQLDRQRDNIPIQSIQRGRLRLLSKTRRGGRFVHRGL